LMFHFGLLTEIDILDLQLETIPIVDYQSETVPRPSTTSGQRDE
jgi:hypothetical protein